MKCIERLKHRTLLAKEGWKYLVIDQFRKYPFFALFVPGPDECCGEGGSGMHAEDYELVSHKVCHPSIASYYNLKSFDDILKSGHIILSSVCQFFEGEGINYHQLVLYSVERGHLSQENWDVDYKTNSGNWKPDEKGEEYYCFKNSVKADTGKDTHIMRIPKNRFTVTEIMCPQLRLPL